MRSIDAIIFDWGGVLIDNPAPAMLARFAEALGVAPDALRPSLRRHGEALARGLCSEAELWAAIGVELNVSPPAEPSLWGRAFAEAYIPKPEVWLLAGDLRRRGYKTALLSNTEMPSVEYLRRQGDQPFDAMVFSCCEGCHKPELRIYELALQRLACPPDRAVFIDDKEEYVQGAIAAGIRGVLFRDAASLVRDLAALGVDLRGQEP